MKPWTANGTGRPSLTITVDGVTIACSETSSACNPPVAVRGMIAASMMAEKRDFRPKPAEKKANGRSRSTAKTRCSGFLAIVLNIQGGVSVLVGSYAPLGLAGNRNVGRGHRGACEITATATALRLD